MIPRKQIHAHASGISSLDQEIDSPAEAQATGIEDDNRNSAPRPVALCHMSTRLRASQWGRKRTPDIARRLGQMGTLARDG